MEHDSKFNLFAPGELDFLPVRYRAILHQFCSSFVEATDDFALAKEILHEFVMLVKKQIESPHAFLPYHRKVTAPHDYERFGNRFIKALIDLPHSSIAGVKHFEEAERALKRHENVVFFANHQIEADPQVLSILLGQKTPFLVDKLTFIAGERVVTDPLAVPFSMGCNLLCIYSKKYIDNPPEDKARKQLHNQRTMELMSDLLAEGGLAIYVAPSGGRDRPNANGVVEVSPFDSRSIEMFALMAKKARRPTHFYPLALKTYAILPPPDTLQIELGEARTTSTSPVHIACGEKLDLDSFTGSDESNRQKRRENRAHFIWQKVCEDYQKFPGDK